MSDSLVNVAQDFKKLVPQNLMLQKYQELDLTRERLAFVKEFSYTLCSVVYDTYLGHDFIHTEDDIIGHYKWSLKKVIDQYEKLGIIIKPSIQFYKYFMEHFVIFLYDNKTEQSLQKSINFFTMFNSYSNPKTVLDFYLLLELYGHFNDSLFLLSV